MRIKTSKGNNDLQIKRNAEKKDVFYVNKLNITYPI